MSETVMAVRDTIFSKCFKTHRLQAGADLRNVGSWRVMEKIGMKREGILRQQMALKGGWVDAVWYAILRAEWERLVSSE